MEVSAFMTEQLKAHLKEQREHDEKQRQEAKAERQEFDAMLQRQRREFEAKLAQREAESRAEAQAEREARQSEIDTLRDSKLRDGQLAALQSRLDAMHASKLLSDDERDAVEDIIADNAAGLIAAAGGGSEGEEEDARVSQMLALSSRMVADRAFARQLRRRYTT
jgi:hypothetical protein